MSEYEAPTIEDLIAKSTEKDFVSSDKIFAELMQNRLDAALDQEKIRMAGQIYNGLEPEEMEAPAEYDEDQGELDLEDEEEQIEMELESEEEPEMESEET